MAALVGSAGAQTVQRHFTDGVDTRVERGYPVLSYQLTIRDGDTTGYDVRMSVRGARDTFRIALARHPEYDDKYFRYVENLRSDATVTIAREDSAVWRVVAPGGEAVIEYRIALPPAEAPNRAAWRPFLAPTGALVGGPHSFMYVVGAELAPAHVTVLTPWSRISTGLAPTQMPNVFYATNAYVLVESPILTGEMSSRSWLVDGVPHSLFYWGRRGGPAFDTTAFAGAIEKLTHEAVRLFGRAPYREYQFQIQDNAYGGLEHHNSVTIGAPSSALSTNVHSSLREIAHEFIHTWNLMRIRPAEYVGVTYRQIRPVPILWFSEGLTIFYGDLLQRRAGLPATGATRADHLAGILGSYLGAPGNGRFSAEQIGRVAYNARPDALGDYTASAHLSGEVLGNMLDLIVRDATDGRRSMDDVMRWLFERSGPAGTTGADIERAVASVCGCVVAPFFAAHVRGPTGTPLDYNKYLALVGLKAAVTQVPAARDSVPFPDHRIGAWNPPGDSLLSLVISNPATVWGRAGLHSGDKVITFNGNSARSWAEFRVLLGRTRIGDDVHIVVQDRRSGVTRDVAVKLTGYDRPLVTISEVENATDKQKRLREAWLAGK